MVVRMLYILSMHQLAQDLAILSDPKEVGNEGKTSGQNPNAGWFNKFVQTGKSDHETQGYRMCALGNAT